MLPSESDGLMAYRQPPMVVVLPDTTEQVSQILKYCFEQGIKVVPRGSGTSLSGGALPLADGVLLGIGKFKRIREIDFDNRVVVTEPGVTNLAISQAVAHAGYYYAPDPSSQIACSIGGNVAENSGGVHCLKYGMTTNNVLGCEIVLITGEILRIRGQSGEDSLDVEALLIIELDGPGVEVDELIKRVEAIAQGCGSTTCQISNSETERNLFWAGRKAAFPAVGRISPDYLCMDGTIPRGKLPEALARIRDLSVKYDPRVAKVFPAGDGNLHPLILYDAKKAGEMGGAEASAAFLLRTCAHLGANGLAPLHFTRFV